MVRTGNVDFSWKRLTSIEIRKSKYHIIRRVRFRWDTHTHNPPPPRPPPPTPPRERYFIVVIVICHSLPCMVAFHISTVKCYVLCK